MEINKNKEYTWKEICSLYGFLELVNKKGPNKREKGFLLRGVIIEKTNNYKNGHIACYKVINDDIFNEDWKECVDYPSCEVSKQGHLREKSTKILKGSLDNSCGYMLFRPNPNKAGLRIHRLVLNTFNPIKNSKEYYVDHINGIRTDNRLENLRWVTKEENMRYKIENRREINLILQKLIEKEGYEEIYQYLLKYPK